MGDFVAYEFTCDQVHTLRQILHAHLLEPARDELRRIVLQIIEAEVELFDGIVSCLNCLQKLY